ncbi:MAG: hypothetical protein Q4Q62_05915 [Thermoplasmata archaeon]|nr:hypothetical protein [Thermoplasmata archaeon]
MTEAEIREGITMMPLSEVMGLYGEKNVSQALASYRAVKDSDTETFLHDKAINQEKKDVTRTYVAIDDVTKDVVGFISLGVKSV